MKDSLAYRGAVFWNTISLNKPGFSHTNQSELYTIDWKHDFIIFDRFIDMMLDVLFYYSYLFIL